MADDLPELIIPGITNPSTLAVISRSRMYEQYVKAIENAEMGICPFCTIDRSYNTIIHDGGNFYVLLCRPPEKNTRLHFLFVPKRHVKSMDELSQSEAFSLLNAMRKIRKEYGIISSGILIRDGNATLSAGTIEHLHIHMMVPDGTGRVESPFFKGAEAERESRMRAIVFEKIRQLQYSSRLRGWKLPAIDFLSDLSEEERELVADRL